MNCGSPGDTHVETPGKQSETQLKNAIWQHTVCAGAKGQQPESPRAERLKGRHGEEKETVTETENASIRPGHPLAILVSQGKGKRIFPKAKGSQCQMPL